MGSMLALLLSLCTLSGELDGTRPAPDVVVFVIDDVGDVDVDLVRTPAIDSLAARGMRFRRAYTHAYCNPTRVALLLSDQYGDRHGADCDPPVPETLDFGATTLPKVFAAAGYRTAHFGKWHLGTNRVGNWEATAHLFGYADVRAGMPIGCDSNVGEWPRLDDGQATSSRVHKTIALREALREWWTRTEGPKLAVVNFLAAHKPFQIPPDSILYPWYDRPIFPTQREKFEAEIIGADFVLGELLPLFETNTLIVFLGDNGTPSEVPPPGVAADRVKLSCYEGGVRVPLIVAHPSLLQGVETDALVHAVDFLPTFAALLGLPLQVPVDGVSFADVLAGGGTGRDYVFVRSPGFRQEAIVGRRFKLFVDDQEPPVLYDLLLDPNEETPLPPAGKHAEQLLAWHAEVTR